MKEKLVFGTLVLTCAGIIAKVLGALYRVPLISLIGTGGIGMFQLIYPIFALLIVIGCGGVSVALSKIISIEYENKRYENIKKYLSSSLITMFFVGVVLSAVLILLSTFISNMQGYQDIYCCYIAIAPAILFSCLISVVKGYFQGLENMVPSGVVQILEQLFKLIFALLFASLFVKKSIVYAVMGTFLGISLSEFISLLYCILVVSKNKVSKTILHTKNKSSLSYTYCFQKLVKTSFPIMLNVSILPLVSAIESLIIVGLLSKAGISGDISLKVYGLQNGLVSSLINMPIVIAVAISTALIPNLSVCYNNNDMASVKQKCESVLKYVWIISLPCALIYFFFSKQIIYFLYSSGLGSADLDQFLVATNLLKLCSINIIYISILNAVTAMLQACNKSFVPVKNLMLSSIIKIVLNFVLVSRFNINIYGIVITDIICYSLACVLDLMYLKKLTNFGLDLKKVIVVPIFSCCFMIMVAKVVEFALFSRVNSKVITLLSVSLALIVYLVCLIKFKTFSVEEISVFNKFKLKKRNKV